MKQADRYPFEGLITHLAGAGDGQRLFELVEKRGFLARQADSLETFGQTSADVEGFLLPAAVAARSWLRFLHYAALAVNLRGLAEDLAEPEILRALAESGHVDLALDATGRLAGLWDQAMALAAVAAGCSAKRAERKEEILALLCDRLDDLAASPRDEKAAGKALLAIATEVGPALQECWPEWIRYFAPGHGGEIRLALASRWLRERDALAPGLWQALEALGNPAQVMAIAPRGLAGCKPADPQQVLARLGSLLPGAARRQEAGAAFLGCLAEHDPARAVAAWETWTAARERPAWTLKTVRAAAAILGRLPSPQVEEIAAAIQDPAALAALRVAVLESCVTKETAAAALKALAAMPDHEDKLHWSLRYLTALPQEPSEEARRQVMVVGEHLHAIGYAVDGEELARYLDLVTVFLPGETRTRLESIVWSHGVGPKKLLQIAGATRQPAVALLLLERAERYAATVSDSEQSGFENRKQLLITAACKYFELKKELEALPSLVERLLPEEEDELRQKVAQLPGLLPDGRTTLCESITDDRLRLLTRLRLSSAQERAEELTPSKLYASLAQVGILREECSGLAALLEWPDDPQGLLQQHVLPLRTLRTRALLRLARHTVAFEKEFSDRPDLLLPLELVRWLITTETDEELAALTPEIAELAAAAGGSRSTTEVQEAARQLAALEAVDWRSRREALEALLARLASGHLLPARKAAAALTTILRLPQQLRPEAARQQLRRRWSEVLPLVIAAADRLPEKNLRPVRRALQEGLRDLAPDAAQQRVFALCLAAPADRTKAADQAGVTEIEALAYLLIKPSPHLVPEVVERLPVPERVRLTLRLLRHGWLPEETARMLLQGVSGSGSEDEAEVWCGPRQGDEAEWIARAALWMANAAPSSSDPRIEPLLARLWSASEVWRPALAGAVQDSLRRGGRAQGEAILRLWLHAHLAPHLGQGRSQGLAAAADSEETLQLALALGPERSSP